MHSLALEQVRYLRETMVFDHEETFQYCQEMPVGIGTAVGKASLFTFGLDPVPHRAGGPMTPGRARRLKALEKRAGPLPTGSYRRSLERILEQLIPKSLPGEPLHLITDGKPDYRAAARRHIESGKLRMESYPNPPRRPKHVPRGRHAAARDRAMFPVDVLHKLIRHSSAGHKRETLAHGRRANAIMLRLYGFTAWRNFIKDKSERCPLHKTPAMEIGLTERFWDWKQVLVRRLFPWRIRLSEMERKLYAMKMDTPVVGRNRRHDLVNAF